MKVGLSFFSRKIKGKIVAGMECQHCCCAVAIAAQCEKWKIFLRYFSPNSLRWLTVNAVLFWLFHKGQSNNAMQDVRPSSKIISHNCATSIATNLLLSHDFLHICKEGSA